MTEEVKDAAYYRTKMQEGSLAAIKDENSSMFDLILGEEEVKPLEMPENVFREYFLPFFLGYIAKDKYFETQQVWLGLAGGPNRPVKITGPKGEILFTVPPLMNLNQEEVDRSTLGSEKLANLFIQFAEGSRVSSAMAINELYDGLGKRLSGYSKGTTTIDDWKPMIDFYSTLKADGSYKNAIANITDKPVVNNDDGFDFS